jgi:hypothetical protein
MLFPLGLYLCLLCIRITNAKSQRAMDLGRIIDWLFISRSPKYFTTGEGKSKGTVHPRTSHEGPEGE